MNKPFDMEIYLAGVLTGAHASRERHIRQAKTIQAAISERWSRDNPWTWQRKHLVWFFNHHMNSNSKSTRYYYLLTTSLITLRLGKSWSFQRLPNASNCALCTPHWQIEPANDLIGIRADLLSP